MFFLPSFICSPLRIRAASLLKALNLLSQTQQQMCTGKECANGTDCEDPWLGRIGMEKSEKTKVNFFSSSFSNWFSLDLASLSYFGAFFTPLLWYIQLTSAQVNLKSSFMQMMLLNISGPLYLHHLYPEENLEISTSSALGMKILELWLGFVLLPPYISSSTEQLHWNQQLLLFSCHPSEDQILVH